MPSFTPEEYGRRLKAQRDRTNKLYKNIDRLAALADNWKTWQASQEAMMQAMQEAILELGRIVKDLKQKADAQHQPKGHTYNAQAYEFTDIGRDEDGNISSARVHPVLKH